MEQVLAKQPRRRRIGGRTAAVLLALLTLHALRWATTKVPLRLDSQGRTPNSSDSYNGTAVQAARVAWRTAYAQQEAAASSRRSSSDDEPLDRCAIHLYGLPRAFDSLVLPSLIRNVIQVNALYGCDYFVHYYNLTAETAGRSGDGGVLDPHQIRRSLPAAVEQWRTTRTPTTSEGRSTPSATATATVHFAMDQEAAFWKRHEALLHKIHTTMDATTGRPVYHPWADASYTFPATVNNIMKMWHSIAECWRLMEAQASRTGIRYSRVAMLRSDVVYMTPVDIWERGTPGIYDVSNRVAVIPGFGKFPVSDRLIYGPYEAVRLWADTRFARLEQHVAWAQAHQPGMALHSETFVQQLLLTMRAEVPNLTVDEHETMCFFRARVDESVWMDDCDHAPLYASPLIQHVLPANRRAAVEAVIGRACTGGVRTVATGARALFCPTAV
jgi:hypothetical protein